MSGQRNAVHPGDVLAGRYRVERVIGRGMGVVVQAVDLNSGAPCAVKLLGAAALSHPTAVERFFREARATARLQSPHVVRVFDVGVLDTGAPYMAMELLAGDDLATILARRGALPAHEAARYAIDACRALAEAHENGIVHRDLKPKNLFLARHADGTTVLKVIDFGISKALGPTAGDDELTVTNTVLGSPAYMSPEQIRSARDVDARTDVWSLGVVLYFLVTGKLPFYSARAADMVALVVRSDPAPPSQQRPGLPHALDSVILRCLEKDPARRFATMNDLAAALAPFVPAAPVTAMPAPARRAALPIAIAAVGAFLLVAAIAAFLLR